MGRYTEDEINRIYELNAKGLGPKEISESLPNRTYSSVRTKIRELGLRIKPLEAKITETFDENLHKLLKRRPSTITELANHYDVGPKRIQEAVDRLHDQGYNVKVEGEESVSLYKELSPRPPLEIDVKKFFGKRFRFGAISDTHLGSKHERLDVLNALYDVFEEEGINTVFHGGNWIEGTARFNKTEIYVHTFDEQVDNFLKKYPNRDGITTYFVDGDDHEGWYMQREGIEPGRILEDRAKQLGREDLVYLGYMERDIILKAKDGEARLRLMHGGGGSSYATSYKTQKITESLAEGEKPHIMLVGHYHKAVYHVPRGIHVLQLGTTQDQTRFMRKKHLRADVGGWLVEINQANTGEINRFQPEWIQFYNQGFYDPMVGDGRDIKSYTLDLETKIK